MNGKNSIIFFVGAVTLFSVTASAQNRTIDSLQKILLTQKEDTSKVNTLNSLALEFKNNNPDTANYFVNSALTLATALNYEMGIADAKCGIGLILPKLGKYEEGLKSCNDALELYDQLLISANPAGVAKIQKRKSFTYNGIGIIYLMQGNFPGALQSLLEALRIQGDAGDKKEIAEIQNNLGILYWFQRNYAKGLEYFSASLKLREEIGDKKGASDSYNNIGALYTDQLIYDEGLKNYQRSLKLAKEIGDKSGISSGYLNMGIIKTEQGEHEEGLKEILYATKIAEEIGNKLSLAIAYENAGLNYTRQKKFKAAYYYLNKALTIAKEIGGLDEIREFYEDLARLDSTAGDYKQSLQHYKLFIAYRDSLFNKENTEKIVQLQMEYEFGKKEDSLRQIHIIAETKLQSQRKQRYFYWIGLVLLALLSFFVFTNFRNQKKLNRLAADAHAKEKAELELKRQQSVLSERLRISTDLHDEVGATLSGIAMYSHLTKEQMRKGQTMEIERSLSIMQQSSGEMVSKLNDIVWLINPEQDSLQKLVERLEGYARDMAAVKSMQVRVTVPDKIAELSLPVESRRNIYLFGKEAINNAVKYSGGSLLELTIKGVDGKLEFSVGDNGKGFDVVLVRRGNGDAATGG